jgi:hypothetical protein
MPGGDINLDGMEISIIKALGLSGNNVTGEELLERAQDLEIAEMMDILGGLVAMGYVDCDLPSFHNSEAFKKAHFHVNSGYAHDLKEALNPKPEAPKSRRVRRE